jgi:hypothetical protein
LSYRFSILSLTEHPSTAQDSYLSLPSLINADFRHWHLVWEKRKEPMGRPVVREQRSDQHEQRGFVAQFTTREVAFISKVAGFTMPFHRYPVI